MINKLMNLIIYLVLLYNFFFSRHIIFYGDKFVYFWKNINLNYKIRMLILFIYI